MPTLASPPSTADPSPVPSPQAGSRPRMPPAHARHVELLLHLLRVARDREPAFGTAPTPPELFLVREEPAAIWEMVGLRVRGCDTVMLGALRFARQPGGGDGHARRSLAHYLCAPPKEIGIARSPRPAGMLELRVPAADETVERFRRRMADGDEPATIFVDAETVELAFDFRLANPSTEPPVMGGAAREERHLFRTTDGQVLSATTPGLHVKLHRDGSFVALRDPVQHTARGPEPLPTLVAHRSTLALAAPVGSPAELGSLLATAPMRAAVARARPLVVGA